MNSSLGSMGRKIMSGGVEGLWKFALWLFLSFGLFLIAVAYFAIDIKTHESWHTFIKYVGSLFLSAGVFAILLKSFQYLQVFREELFKVFEDEKFESLLRKIIHGEHADDGVRLRAFQHATGQYLSNKPEPLRKGLRDAITEFLEGANCDGYYRNFVRTIRISKYNPADQQINLEDEVFIELVPKDTMTKVCYGASLEKASGSIEVQLEVNGKDFSSEVKIGDDNLRYELILEGDESYKIDRKYSRTFQLHADPYMHLRLSRHTLSFKLKIENHVPEKIRVVAKPCGFAPSPEAGGWTTRPTEGKGSGGAQGSKVSTIAATKSSLTFPEQGYIIILYAI